MTKMELGDFTGLARAYSESRPGYAPQIASMLVKLAELADTETIVDMGAGTGIWTQALRRASGARLIAVEPNSEMLKEGIKRTIGDGVEWIKDSAETFETDIKDVKLLTMASSFHWTETQTALSKFRNILSPGGIFCALWNTRMYELNPLLIKIESYLNSLLPDARISSGRSKFTESLFDKLALHFGIENVFIVEARHIEVMSKSRYRRIWESVNDVQVQLGKKKFSHFLDYIDSTLESVDEIEATYLTRAWVCQNSLRM